MENCESQKTQKQTNLRRIRSGRLFDKKVSYSNEKLPKKIVDKSQYYKKAQVQNCQVSICSQMLIHNRLHVVILPDFADCSQNDM